MSTEAFYRCFFRGISTWRLRMMEFQSLVALQGPSITCSVILTSCKLLNSSMRQNVNVGRRHGSPSLFPGLDRSSMSSAGFIKPSPWIFRTRKTSSRWTTTSTEKQILKDGGDRWNYEKQQQHLLPDAFGWKVTKRSRVFLKSEIKT